MVVIKERALKRQISLSQEISTDLDELEIQADERKVKQILYNLLSNAIKFTPDGGAIRVEGRKAKEEVVISVSDTGIGIKPADQNKSFQNFVQIRGGTTDKTPGTGLGLVISRRLTEMQGGKLWVESEGEGKGSRFSFTLPINGKGGTKTQD